MKPTMVLTDEDIQRIRESLAKTLTPRHKIVIAPCLAEVLVYKIRLSILRRPTKEKWSTVGRGVIALIYNTDSLGQRIEVCLTSLKTRAVVWKETVVADLTRIESPQPTFHTFNSTKNFNEKAGIRYENETIARLVLRALSVFSSQSKSLSKDASKVSGHKPASRSHSFNVAPRPRHPRAHESAFERCTVALSNIQIQQVFSTEGRQLAERQTATLFEGKTASQENNRRLVSITEGCEKTMNDISRFENPSNKLFTCQPRPVHRNLSLVRRCTEPVFKKRDLMVTDLCTTEL